MTLSGGFVLREGCLPGRGKHKETALCTSLRCQGQRPSPWSPSPCSAPASQCCPQVPQNPRLQGYRGRDCQPSICWPWQEGGRISRPHLQQGKAEVSHPRHKAKSAATMNLASMCHHRRIQPGAHPRYRRLAQKDRPATLHSEGSHPPADPSFPLHPWYTRFTPL